ncbi:MAG: hypothetical protein U0167_14355 [bacterium]
MSRLRVPMIVLAAALLVSACAKKQADTPPPPAEKVAAMSLPIDLTPAKVAEIAQVAVQIAKNPTMSTTILQQHGFNQEQLDQAMGKIVADSTMSALFQQAKAEAEAQQAAAPAETPAAGGTEAGK